MAAASAATAAQLAIAKVSLTAVLLRPDPAPCPRADIDEFAGLLALTAARCSPANVQTCKQWMLRHVTHSPARTAAVGRYLVALANSYSFSPVAPAKETKQTSTRRKRLHLLYIVNDVLYHVTFRDNDNNSNNNNNNSSTRAPFAASIESSLLPLVTSAATFVRAPKQLARLNDLLDLWANQHYVGDGLLAQLRAAVEKGPRRAKELQKTAIEQDQKQKEKHTSTSSKEAPFLLPALHGDPAAPWYDLPAATWLAVLEPNSTRPMNPAALKPLQLAPGPAPPSLEASVRTLLADVNRMFEGGAATTTTTDVDSDVDALGERIDIDVFSGGIVGGDTYYGWSRAFCKNMKDRRRRWRQGGAGGPNTSPDRGRTRQKDSRSPSLSPPRSSSSKPAFKRRRISASPSPGGRDVSRRGRSRSQSDSRSRSRDRRREDKSQSRLHVPGHRYHDSKASSSRSPPRHSHQTNRYRRRSSRSKSRSNSRSRSRSKHRFRSRSRSRPRSISRSRSRSRSRSPQRHRERDQGRYSRSPHKASYEHNDQPYPALGRTPPPHLQHNLPPVPYHQQQQNQQSQQQYTPSFPAFPPPHPGMAAGFPFVPPPFMPPVPPPGYQGQWPPPIPPQLPPHAAWPGAAPPPPPPVAPGPATGDWTGGWAASTPPPPPPPQQYQHQQHQQHQQPYQQHGQQYQQHQHQQHQQHPEYQQQHYDQQRNPPYGQPPQHDPRGGSGSWDRSRGWQS